MRVLFVPDFRYWITATIAEQIVKNNHCIGGIICSVPLLDDLVQRDPSILDDIDLVHFLVPAAGRSHLPKFQGKVPCVTTIHHIEPGYVENAVSLNAEADAVMVVSEMWRTELISRGVPSEKIVLVPNGVDTTVFKPPTEEERQNHRKSLGFAPDEYVIGFCGKPGRDGGIRKGVDTLIRGLKQLANRSSKIAVAVGGPGWQDILPELQTAGVKVYWRRFLENPEEGAPMYQALDSYWVTSQIEGTPVPLLEAMSSGVCCLTTKVGIAPEIIKDDENGYLFELGDADGFASTSADLIDHPERRMQIGNAARHTIDFDYDWKRTSQCAHILYGTAFRNFERRYPGRNKNKDFCFNEPSTPVSGEMRSVSCYENILVSKNKKWLDTQEQLIWMRELCRMGEKGHAVRFGWFACACNPFNTKTWSALANLVLPESFFNIRRAIKRS